MVRRRILPMVTILSIASVVGFSTHASAETDDSYFKVKKDYPTNVTVYKQSDDGLTPIGWLHESEIYQYERDFSANHIQIEFNGMEGYVYKPAIEKINADQAGDVDNWSPDENHVRTGVADDHLTIYESEDDGSLVPMARLYKGETFRFIEQAFGDWIRVQVGEREGYIYSPAVAKDFEQSDDYFKVEKDGLPVNVRDDNGDLQSVATLDEGATFERVQDYGNWHEIRYQGEQAFVWKESTSAVLNPNDAAFTDQTDTPYEAEAQTNVTVYDQQSSEVVGTIEAGETFGFRELTSDNGLAFTLAGRDVYVTGENVERDFVPGDQYFEVTHDYVTVYSDTGDGEVLGQLNQGETFERQGGSGGWHEITFGDETGYIWGDGTTTPSYHGNLTNPVTSDGPTYEAEITSKTELKTAPNANAESFGSVEAGDKFPGINDGEWLKVSVAGNVAYIDQDDVASAESRVYVEYDQSLSSVVSTQMAKSTPPQTDAFNSEPAYVQASAIDHYDGPVIDGDHVALRTDANDDSSDSIYERVSNGTAIEIVERDIEGFEYNDSTEWYRVAYDDRDDLYVHSELVSETNDALTVENSSAPVYAEMSTNSHVYGRMSSGQDYEIVDEHGDWYEIDYRNWRNAKRSQVVEHADPSKHSDMQHLLLSESVKVSANELNTILAGHGVLEGQAEQFIDAGREYGINEIYLMSHAMLETGNGTSELATGVEVGRDDDGDLQLVNDRNRDELSNIRTTYNIFGIGAYDRTALESGATRAYEEGWFTVEEAIVGGAKWIGERYINHLDQQNTLFKMRWNPDNTGVHQYATDIGWAVKQSEYIEELYNELTNPVMTYEIPVYQ
ncbi:beta-N-acetylglucosaminidase [Alkalibacillus flavidus]|uniref:Beta-N-acetylglucosaminidase n=1 Tax=Alkalibacillus flavidus TaxID=546021 RepID=A0ABV2KXB3_9BACI